MVFDKAPERIMLVSSSPVPALKELGVLDRAIARAGAYPDEYYDADTRAAIAAVPSLGEELDDVGHLQISQDTIIAQDPDLLFGLPDG
ncbi:MAG: ABC transporter substrate-binding protein, partial [Actinomycetota bacterium]